MNLKKQITDLLKTTPMGRLSVMKHLPDEDPRLISRALTQMIIDNKLVYDGHDFSIAKKKSKYNNVITETDGIKFRSKKESDRYLELKMLEKSGVITDLKLQVPFVVAPVVDWDGVKLKPIKYYADFVYVESGQKTIEDAKGRRLPLYLLKRSLVILNNPEYRFKES